MEDNEEIVDLGKIDLDTFLLEGCAIAGLLDGVYQDVIKYGRPKETGYLITLVETYFYCKISLLEAISYQRAYERAHSDIEKSICLTYFDIIVGEGTTYLCGYEKGKGSHKLSRIKNEMPKCKGKQRIIEICDSYIDKAKEEGFFSTLKVDKNSAKHYSPDYLKVVDHLRSIQNQSTFDRIGLYLVMVAQLSDAISNYLVDSGRIETYEFDDDAQINRIDVEIVVLDESLPRLEAVIRSDEQMLYGLANIEDCYRKTLDFEKHGIFKHDTATSQLTAIEFFLKVSGPVWHLYKVRLDFNYAIRAYHESKDKLEQRAHLYRALLALYEGCILMTEGYPKDGVKPLFNSVHKYISDCRDNHLNALERKIKRDLNAFHDRMRNDYYEPRNYLTHAKDDKNKDKVLEKYYWMLRIKPSKLIEDTMSFFNIVRPVWKVVDAIMIHNYPVFWEGYKYSLKSE